MRIESIDEGTFTDRTDFRVAGELARSMQNGEQARRLHAPISLLPRQFLLKPGPFDLVSSCLSPLGVGGNIRLRGN